MSDSGSITRLLLDLKQGDDAAAQRELWDRYFSRLVKLARTMLPGAGRRVEDEEDAALSAMNAFFRGVREERFPALVGRENLWPLLVRIAARAAARQIQRGTRQKRGGGRVGGESALRWSDSSLNAIDQVVGDEPTPQFAAQVAEQCQILLDVLDDDSLRAIARLKLEGFTNREVAAKIDRAERTVEWKLNLIRRTWEAQQERDDDD
jgi:DNA-directed RNA polymerase specialized sigma24 family protein